MKIMEVEQRTGIPKANIRYYESQGLLSPNRSSNGYRAYDESHVEELLKIKLLRSLGLPIASIKALRDGKMSLPEALSRHKAHFREQRQELEASEKIMDILLDSDFSFHDLKPEMYLALMAHGEENPLQRDVHTKPVLPLRRLLARTLDFTFYNLLLYLAAPGLFQAEGFDPFLILAEVLLLLIMEPLLLCAVCTTPGKFVFGMTVTSVDGKRLTYKAALERTALVLRHGLGFCAPFLKEYMQLSSYATAERGGALIWERDSELNIRDSRAWRYVAFALLLAAAMAYPAKMEYDRLFHANECAAAYEGVTPFRGDHIVEEVLYSADPQAASLPLIRLTADEMWFSYSGNTAAPFALIGEFRYAPPAETPAAGVWELQNGAASDELYRLTVEAGGSVLLERYEDLELESRWRLKLLDILQVEFKNRVTRTYITPDWFAGGDFSGNMDLLKPRRFSSEFRITLRFSCEMPDTITIAQEVHLADETRTDRLALTKDEYGSFGFDFTAPDEEGAYVLYRVPYAGGEIVFCVLC